MRGGQGQTGLPVRAMGILEVALIFRHSRQTYYKEGVVSPTVEGLLKFGAKQ